MIFFQHCIINYFIFMIIQKNSSLFFLPCLQFPTLITLCFHPGLPWIFQIGLTFQHPPCLEIASFSLQACLQKQYFGSCLTSAELFLNLCKTQTLFQRITLQCIKHIEMHPHPTFNINDRFRRIELQMTDQHYIPFQRHLNLFILIC